MRGAVRVLLPGLAVLAAAVLVIAVLTISVKRPVGLSGPPAAIAGAPEVRSEGLLDGHTYSQALGPVGDDLTELHLYVDPYDHLTTVPLHLVLADGGVVVRESVVEYDVVDDTARFQFAPITDSSHRHLELRLTAPGAVDRTMVSLYAVPNPPNGVPRLLLDGRDTAAYAPVRARYGPVVSVSEQLQAISDRASRYHPDPFKTPAPLLAAGLALIVTSVLVGIVVGASPDRSDRHAGG